MKLKFKYVLMEIDNMITVVPISEDRNGFQGVMRINETGKIVMEMLSEDTTEEKIIDRLVNVYTETPKEDIENCVRVFLDGLRTEGVLE